jgi:hypothetical protein
MTSAPARIVPALILAAIVAAGCSSKPSESSLRDSFARQLSVNPAVKDLRRAGDDLLFSGPGAEGGVAQWRVRIDSAVIEPTDEARAPLKGTVKASWYSNGQLVRPSRSGRDSNLPIELTANGLAQECWAIWDQSGKKWGWE